jgi:RNA polymerase sigma-70 factor (ECF subfamily)
MRAKPSKDENELIRAAAGGDRATFDELVRLKRERVVRTAYQITGDLDDALDVAQAVFIKIWQGIGRFDLERKFDTWLHRITVNAGIDLLRTRGPKGVLQPLPDDAADFVAAPSRGAEENLDLGLLQQAFSRLAAGLAPQQRAVFVMKEIEGQPTAEVARVLGIAESTVRNHLLQARRILRAGIERDYPGLVPGVRDRATDNENAGEADATDVADATDMTKEKP